MYRKIWKDQEKHRFQMDMTSEERDMLDHLQYVFGASTWSMTMRQLIKQHYANHTPAVQLAKIVDAPSTASKQSDTEYVY